MEGGGQPTIEEFVSARGEALLRFALMLSGQRHIAEDLVQTVLAHAFPRWPRIASMHQPEAYLKKMLLHEYLRWRRRRSSSEIPRPDPADVAAAGDVAGVLASRAAAWSLLARLPRRQRAVLVLRYYEDQADAEIAAILGYAETTVRSHIALEQSGRGMTTRDIVLGGVPATRTEGRLADGRFAGRLAVPVKGVFLDVRTGDRSELLAILDGARLVNVDHLGCPTFRPDVTPAARPDPMAPIAPVAVRICRYEDGGMAGRLYASGELGLDDAAWLAGAINAAPPGRNPDAPESMCTDVSAPQPDVVLQFVGADGTVSRLWVTFSSCAGRGVDNGVRQVMVGHAMIERFMTPLHIGYSMYGDLSPGEDPKPTK